MTVGKINIVPNVYKIKHKEKTVLLVSVQFIDWFKSILHMILAYMHSLVSWYINAGWLIYQLTCACTCPKYSYIYFRVTVKKKQGITKTPSKISFDSSLIFSKPKTAFFSEFKGRLIFLSVQSMFKMSLPESDLDMARWEVQWFQLREKDLRTSQNRHQHHQLSCKTPKKFHLKSLNPGLVRIILKFFEKCNAILRSLKIYVS